MSHHPDDPRHYTDEETALILRRAAELQEPREGPRSARGLTLAEIQQIACEVGIDPAAVAEAAALVSGGERDRWGRLIGAPTRFRYERTVSGDVPDPAWAALVEEIRQVLGKPGQVGHVPGALEWVHEDENGDSVRVGVTSRAGTTRVELHARRGNEAAMLLMLPATAGVLLAMLGGGLSGLEAGPELWTAMGGGAGGGLALGWAGWKQLSARWERRLSTLVARLARVAGQAGERSRGQAEAPAAARLGPPAM